MAFSVYEVIRVSCLSRSWFVYATLKAMQERNLCSRGTVCFICSGIYIAKYMHGSILNKRWVTSPTVDCRPFASEVVLKDFEFAVYSSS